MVKFSTPLLVFVILLNLLFAPSLLAQSWFDVNSNDFAGGIGSSHTLAIASDNTPYLGYSDRTLGGRAVVRQFNGTHWINLGSSPVSQDYANQLCLAVDKNNSVYLAFIDTGVQSQVVVKKFENGSWVSVGKSPVSGNLVDGLSLVLSATGTPYLAYTENGLGIVKRFDGAEWVELGSARFKTSTSQDLSLAVGKNNIPYLAFTDNSLGGKVIVRRFKDNQWVEVGGSISTGGAYETRLTLDKNDNPYVLYRSFRQGSLRPMGTLKVKKFNGTNWEELGSTGFSDKWIFYASLVLDSNNIPYVAYRQSTLGLGNAGLLKVKRFNGQEWEEIGTGISSSGAMQDIVLAINTKGVLYVAFTDRNNQRKAVVLKLDVPSMVISTKAPTNLALATSSDSGESPTDRITKVAQPTITGKAQAQALVTVYLAEKLVGTTTADTAGNWSYAFPVALAAGRNGVRATATDAAGNTSAMSSSLTIFLDLIAPTVTGVSDGKAYASNRTIYFNGGNAQLNQKAFVNGTSVSAEGAHTLMVQDQAGNTTTVQFWILKTAPVASLVINQQASVTNQNQVQISIAAPGATQMRFYDNDDNIIWTKWEPMVSNRTWTLSPGSGSKWIKLQVRDAAGNVSASVYDKITLDQTLPKVVLSSSVTSPTSSSKIAVKLTFSENVSNLTAQAIQVINASKGSLTGSGRYYTLLVLPTTSATIKVTLPAGTVQDAAGNKNATSGVWAVNYVIPVTIPVVSSNSVRVLTTTSVTLGGTVMASGGAPVTERGVVFSTTSSSPSINGGKRIVGSGLGAFTFTLMNVKLGITYYARAYATNAKGTAYGAVQKFILPTAMSPSAAPLLAETSQTTKTSLTSYPNPFQNQATIQFTSAVATDYKVELFDINGNLAQNLAQGKASAGEQVQMSLVGGQLQKGFYVVRLTTLTGVENLKVICAK